MGNFEKTMNIYKRWEMVMTDAWTPLDKYTLSELNELKWLIDEEIKARALAKNAEYREDRLTNPMTGELTELQILITKEIELRNKRDENDSLIGFSLKIHQTELLREAVEWIIHLHCNDINYGKQKLNDFHKLLIELQNIISNSINNKMIGCDNCE